MLSWLTDPIVIPDIRSTATNISQSHMTNGFINLQEMVLQSVIICKYVIICFITYCSWKTLRFCLIGTFFRITSICYSNLGYSRQGQSPKVNSWELGRTCAGQTPSCHPTNSFTSLKNEWYLSRHHTKYDTEQLHKEISTDNQK